MLSIFVYKISLISISQQILFVCSIEGILEGETVDAHNPQKTLSISDYCVEDSNSNDSNTSIVWKELSLKVML